MRRRLVRGRRGPPSRWPPRFRRRGPTTAAPCAACGRPSRRAAATCAAPVGPGRTTTARPAGGTITREPTKLPSRLCACTLPPLFRAFGCIAETFTSTTLLATPQTLLLLRCARCVVFVRVPHQTPVTLLRACCVACVAVRMASQLRRPRPRLRPDAPRRRDRQRPRNQFPAARGAQQRRLPAVRDWPGGQRAARRRPIHGATWLARWLGLT